MDDRNKNFGAAAAVSSAAAEREHMIAVAAYFRAQQRGFFAGDPQADWLAAEADIDGQLRAGSADKSAAAARQKFQHQLREQLNDWDAKVDDWMAKAAQAKTRTRSEIQTQLEVFAAQRATAEKRLSELRAQSADAWEDVKDGAEQAWQEMRTTAERIASRFK